MQYKRILLPLTFAKKFMKILLLEGDPRTATIIKNSLAEHAYDVTHLTEGTLDETVAVSKNFDLVILDIVLPHISGLELCKRIRKEKIKLKILILSALSGVEDRVKGLNCGADDYLGKPFHFSELLARIRALTRKFDEDEEAEQSSSVISLADLTLDVQFKTVTRAGKVIPLTLKEFKLLSTLLYNKNRVLSREHIAKEVWGHCLENQTNLIDVYINYLRTKIDRGFSKQLIYTMIGAGYVIKD